MTEPLFDIAFPLVVPFWALIILAPTWRWTRRIIASPLIVVPPLVVYTILVAPHLGELWATMSQPSLSGLLAFLSTPWGTAAVWAQVLAWDLFIGRWMYHQSLRIGIHPLVMGPLFVFTILLSPFGLLLFLVVRKLCDAPDRATEVVTRQ